MNRLVVGCGYIGLPVACRWLEQGDSVHVVTRSEDRADSLRSLGLVPTVGDITDRSSLNGLFEQLPSLDTVLFAVGMDRSRYKEIRDVYVQGLQNLLNLIPDDVGQFIYISSTGVYGACGDAVVNEESPAVPVREGGKACLEAEQLLQEQRPHLNTTILRLSGIYGPGRIPSAAIIEDKDWSRLSQNGHINFIHRDDAVTAILKTAEYHLPGETILVSDGAPLPRKRYYEILADEFGTGPIQWQDPDSPPNPPGTARTSTSKRICNDKMKRLLKFEPKWLDFRAAVKNAIELRSQTQIGRREQT